MLSLLLPSCCVTSHTFQGHVGAEPLLAAPRVPPADRSSPAREQQAEGSLTATPARRLQTQQSTCCVFKAILPIWR